MTATERCFDLTDTDTTLEITEVAPADKKWHHVSRERAWQSAREQSKPVNVHLLDGTVLHLGVVFDPQAFELAVRSGEISYDLSMTDGIYIPLDREAWLYHFRGQTGDSLYNCDATPRVKASLPAYRAWQQTEAGRAACARHKSGPADPKGRTLAAAA